MKGPQSLAYAFKDIFENVSSYKAHAGFSRGDLAEIAASNKYTNQERAAAELVRLNFGKFATLGDKNATLFSLDDITALANIGLPAGLKIPSENCEKSNPAANAADYAVTVGLISKALGSKQAMSNAIVAGASAAVASEIKNEMSCGQ